MSLQTAARLRRICSDGSLGGAAVIWNDTIDTHAISGTLKLDAGRIQPFVLHLATSGPHLLVRCVSPVGRLDNAEEIERAKQLSRRVPEQLGIIEEADDRGIDLTVEEEVLLGEPAADYERIGWLAKRVTAAADHFETELWPDRDATYEDVKSQLGREGRVTNVERT
jgi:hypothetical protein